MRIPLLAVAAPLLVAGGLLGLWSDEARATPRAAPGAASLLGGFSAVVVQVLWMRADQAVLDHREEDAQVLLAAITELEPQLVSASDHVARILGFDLADGHSDPALRWALAREGWDVLSRAVRRNPGEAAAHAARGGYALLRMGAGAEMRAGFVRDVSPDGPFEAARRDFETVAALRPRWAHAWYGLGQACLWRGVELLHAGRADESAAALRRSAEAFGTAAALLAADGDPGLADFAADVRASADVSRRLAAAAEAPEGLRERAYEDLRRGLPERPLPPWPGR